MRTHGQCPTCRHYGADCTCPELTYDGFGINGPDQYRSRVATFATSGLSIDDRKRYGYLFAASPALLEAAKELLAYFGVGNPDDPQEVRLFTDMSAAIAKASGEA